MLKIILKAMPNTEMQSYEELMVLCKLTIDINTEPTQGENKCKDQKIEQLEILCYQKVSGLTEKRKNKETRPGRKSQYYISSHSNCF